MNYAKTMQGILGDWLINPAYVAAQYLAYPITAPISYVHQLMITPPSTDIAPETLKALVHSVFSNNSNKAKGILAELTCNSQKLIVTQQIEFGDSLIHIAVRHTDSFELVKVLLKPLKDDSETLKSLFDTKGSTGEYLVSEVGKSKNHDTLRLILDYLPYSLTEKLASSILLKLTTDAAKCQQFEVVAIVSSHVVKVLTNLKNTEVLALWKAQLHQLVGVRYMRALFLSAEEFQAVSDINENVVETEADNDVDEWIRWNTSFTLEWAMKGGNAHVKQSVKKLPAAQIKLQLMQLMQQNQQVAASVARRFDPSQEMIQCLYPYSDCFILPNVTQSKSKKYALILSFTFKDRNNIRLGAEQEIDDMTKALDSIGFICDVKVDQPILESITKVISEIGSCCAALFLCVMSHGKKGWIEQPVSHMTFVPISLILEQLEHLPKYIPKVVVIQACQQTDSQIRQEQLWGPANDPAVYQQAEYESPATAREQIELNTNLENTVLMMATASGGYAMRNFFIQTLAEEICRSDGNIDINAVFTRVSNAMSSHEHRDFRKQIPNYSGTLRKFLFLPASSFRGDSI